ncbi:hypothetical protein ACSBR1_008025 [Camellia fascicularis]
MDAKSLFKFFSKFGIVKDVFIPSKRRVVSHSRFGFVRFDCNVAADIAIQKANGLLVDDKVLEVKAATLDRRKREEHNRRNPEVVKSQFIRRSFEANRFRGHAPFVGQRSFADVLQGVNTNTSVKVTEEGNGWLYESAVIRLNTEHSIHSVREALKEKGLDHILVRKGGGRDSSNLEITLFKKGVCGSNAVGYLYMFGIEALSPRLVVYGARYSALREICVNQNPSHMPGSE